MSTITAPFRRQERRATLAGGITQQALLLCGIGASCFYVAGDLLGALQWRGYHLATQATSELTAIDAPSRVMVVPLMLIYSLFTIAFAIGLREVAGARNALRLAGNFLLVVGVLGLVLPFFPMHLRGLTPTTTDAVHLTIAAAQTLLVLFAISAGAALRDDWFRFFSFVVLSLIVLFGVMSAMQGPQVAANLATPWLGVTARLAVYAYLAWVAVLAVVLVREQRTWQRT